MANRVNELMVLRRKKKKNQKIILASILFFCMFIIFLFKTPIFAIKNIEVENNKIVDSKEIKKLSMLTDKDNIFYLNTNTIKKNIKLNPYISDVEVERKLPCDILITVSEKPALFCTIYNNEYLILNNELRILEKREALENINLLELSGLDVISSNVSDIITKNKDQLSICKEFSKVLEGNKTDVSFSKLDLNDELKLILYHGDVLIKLGTEEDLLEQTNKAINILQNNNINLTKGYIDLSFKGNPVIKQDA
jgi:cell division protein FtsQ